MTSRVLTLASGHATIKPNYKERTAGYHITFDQFVCRDAWADRGKVREPDAVFHARIMTYMAGAETEAELLGRIAIGDSDDRYQIALTAEELCYSPPWDRLEPRLRS